MVRDRNIRNNKIKPQITGHQPCLSFTRLSFLQKNNIQFYPHIIHEDELYTAMLYLTATRVNYIKEVLFKRRIRKEFYHNPQIFHKKYPRLFHCNQRIEKIQKTKNRDC